MGNMRRFLLKPIADTEEPFLILVSFQNSKWWTGPVKDEKQLDTLSLTSWLEPVARRPYFIAKGHLVLRLNPINNSRLEKYFTVIEVGSKEELEHLKVLLAL